MLPQATATLLLAMYAKRRVTGATSRSFGHEDTFGKVVDDGLENKVCIPLADAGGWAEGPKLWKLDEVGPLPPGALAYVRVKAATICRAGRDLEFHQLAGTVHLSGDTEAWLKTVADDLKVAPPPASPTRGVWGADGLYHPAGVALTDWCCRRHLCRRHLCRRPRHRSASRRRGAQRGWEYDSAGGGVAAEHIREGTGGCVHNATPDVHNATGQRARRSASHARSSRRCVAVAVRGRGECGGGRVPPRTR